MVQVIQGPSWFLQTGAGIEILGAIILALIAFAVLRYYRLTRQWKWLRIGISFAILSSSAVGHAVLTLGLLVKPWGPLEGGIASLVITSSLLRSLVFFGAVFLLELFTIYGLFLLFTSYHETSKTLHGLVAFLVALLLYFATDVYFIFHLLALVFSALITTSLINHYYEFKRSRTRWLIAGFGLLAISRLFYILVGLFAGAFVIGSILQILGLLLILFTFFQVVRHGKKVAA